MNDEQRDDEEGVTPAELTPEELEPGLTPEEAEARRIQLESDIIREDWRERDTPESS